MKDDGACAVREDGLHCDHWWDGEECCDCKAPPMTRAEMEAQGMEFWPMWNPPEPPETPPVGLDGHLHQLAEVRFTNPSPGEGEAAE